MTVLPALGLGMGPTRPRSTKKKKSGGSRIPSEGMGMYMRSLVHRVCDVGDPRSLAARSRHSRWLELSRRFPDLSELRVLDLGGTPVSWLRSPVRPNSVVTLNLTGALTSPESWITCLTGDATNPPPELRGEAFDLVYSNSVIEHVGGHEARTRFVETVRACAPRYWVQTPSRYFPLEPHWMFPGFQFLPVGARMAVSRRWPYGHIHSTAQTAFADVSGVELLTPRQMLHYFPDGQVWRERILGMTKSVVAHNGIPAQ
jgi:hypothetical protein